MDSFSPTFKWIVPMISMGMRDRSFSYGQKAYLIQAKVGEKMFFFALNPNLFALISSI